MKTERPVIGIVEWPYLDKDNDYIYEVMTPIIEWVVRSGGIPIGIFPSNIDNFVDKDIYEIPVLTEIEQKNLYSSLSMCDAIIKPGATKTYNHERQIYDFCHQENIPFLGICAGMQMMAAYGTERMANVKNDSNVNHKSKDMYSHKILIKELTLLKKILNKDEIMVNSRHNYHIPNSGCQKISAVAEDNVIEAIESPINDFQIGVQWHPELLPKDDENSQIIFGELIEHAKSYHMKKI